MKRYLHKSVLLSLLLSWTSVGIHAQSWNFASLPATDEACLKADAQNWKYDSSKKRYSYNQAITDGELMANKQVLGMTQGLHFTAGAADKIRIDTGKELQFNGTNIVLTIPGLKAGQQVTIVFASSSKKDARTLALSNLSDTKGFAKANGTNRQTGTGTVAADGSVAFTTADGGINVYSLKVTDSSGGGGTGAAGGTLSSDHSVGFSTTRNQAMVTTTNGETKYYNTDELSDISIDDAKETVAVNGLSFSDVYTHLAVGIAFSKAAEQGENGEITDNGVTITESKGWLETAYAKWKPVDGAQTYHVYVKGGQYAGYTRVDAELVRAYTGYLRVDIPGLKAGTYALKVVAVKDGVEGLSGEVTGLQVKNYNREGFAHKGFSGVGAYNNDGTLKSGAVVIYVNKDNAKTVSARLSSGTFTGLQAILNAYQKGNVTTPLAVRVLGLVKNGQTDAFGSSAEGIQIKGKRADSELNITIEGIGEDATIHGFGFLVRNSKSVEFRNLGIMRAMDDGISLDTDNSNIWIHHIDVFYGKAGGGDHAKGDGAIDVKSNSKFVTIDHCHFWDTGKSSMCGMKSESGPNYITYHHNWFDHSDSRHARVRTMSVHLWNNFYDGCAKYGIGATTGSSVFSENNYFRATKDPILISLQGTDAKGSGTFSGESGGMVKEYGSIFAEKGSGSNYSPITYAADNKSFDFYQAATRDEQVPSSVVSLNGGNTYNNFDTNPSLMYSYTPDATAAVPSRVTGYYGAGRLNHGSLQFKFDNAVEDTNDAPIPALETLIDSYTGE